jgi:hypothetical protein
MALRNCRECGKQVSMTAPTCPHCGVKKPYKKTFSDMPKWQQYFVFLTLGPVAVMIAIGYANREDAGLKRVQDLSDDQYKGKYEEYVNLNEISPSTGYKNKATEYGKKYLQTIPVTEASKNLQIYKNLADFDPTSDYEGKIALYSFMVDVSTSCAISAQKMSKGGLNNPSTYDSHALGSGGKWLSQNRYGYVHSFGGANAFGVATNFQAEYVCNTNADTKKYSVQRVSLTKN